MEKFTHEITSNTHGDWERDVFENFADGSRDHVAACCSHDADRIVELLNFAN